MVEEEVARRLADAVRGRRTELGMSQADVVRAAQAAGHDLSVQTMSAIERGTRSQLRPVTAAAIDAALRWPSDTTAGILNGTLDAARAGTRPDPGRSDDALAALQAEVRALREAIGQPDPKTADVRTVAGVLRMLSPDQRRVFAEALDVVEAET